MRVIALVLALILIAPACYAAEIPLGSADVPWDYNAFVAAKFINGKVLNPGEEFSFNRTVGERTRQKGFVMGTVISRSRNGPVYSQDIGGGICKLATALYQAALRSGFKITERHKHSLPVPYAQDDAAVSWPSKDLRFINTSEYPVKILIQETRDSLNVSFVNETLSDETANSDGVLVYVAGRAFPGIESNSTAYVPLRLLAQEAGAEVGLVCNGFVLKKDGFEMLRYSDQWFVKGSSTGGPKPLLKDNRWYVPYEKAITILAQ